MRIAFVSICGMPWGGSEVLWTATAKEALAQGHEVLVSVFDWPQQHQSVRELKSLGAKFIYRRRFYPAFFTRLRKKIFNLFLPSKKKITYHDYIDKYQAERILFSLAGGDEIASDTHDLMIFIKQTRIPFFVFYHSISFDDTMPEAVKNNYRTLLEKSRQSLFTSKMQVNQLEKQIDHVIKNALVFNHPIRKFNFIPIQKTAGTPAQFCIIGSLVSRWKGQDTAIEVLGQVKWKQRDWMLNIYGSGEDLLTLETMAAAKGIKDRVIFHGHDPDIENILANNDLVLIPSKKDSGPIVLFEAMLGARPVVGTFMGAMPEYIINESTGVLAKSTNCNDFDDVLEKAWVGRAEWRTWGNNAKEYLLSKYNFKPEKDLLQRLVND